MQYLTSIIQQGGAAEVTLQTHRDDFRSQTRNVHVLILVGLISFVFSKGITDGTNQLPSWIGNIERFKDQVCALAVIVCMLMYGLDVHVNDLMERGIQVSAFGTNAVMDILKVQPTDTSYYTLDYRQSDSTQVATANFGNRIPREAYRALQPNVEQVAFYMLPLALFALFWMRSRPGQ